MANLNTKLFVPNEPLDQTFNQEKEIGKVT